jgi:hypothetical protein
MKFESSTTFGCSDPQEQLLEIKQKLTSSHESGNKGITVWVAPDPTLS